MTLAPWTFQFGDFPKLGWVRPRLLKGFPGQGGRCDVWTQLRVDRFVAGVLLKPGEEGEEAGHRVADGPALLCL